MATFAEAEDDGMVSFPAPPWPRKPEEFPRTLAHFVSDDEVEGGRARSRDEIRLRHAKRAEADDFERAAPRGKTVAAPPARAWLTLTTRALDGVECEVSYRVRDATRDDGGELARVDRALVTAGRPRGERDDNARGAGGAADAVGARPAPWGPWLAEIDRQLRWMRRGERARFATREHAIALTLHEVRGPALSLGDEA